MNKRNLLLIIGLILVISAGVIYYSKNRKPVEPVQEVTSPFTEEKVTQPTVPPSITTTREGLSKSQIITLVEGLKTMIEKLNKAEIELNVITKKTSADMVKDPYNSTLQQAGKNLIDHNNKIISVGKEIIGVYTKIINTVTPYLDSKAVITEKDLSPMIEDYQVYMREYSFLENDSSSFSAFESTKSNSQN